MIIRNYLYTLLLVLLTFVAAAQQKITANSNAANLSECRAILENDVLTLENSRVRRQYNWNNGNLISQSLTNKSNNYTWQLEGKAADNQFPGTGKPANGKLEVKQVAATAHIAAHLRAEVNVALGDLEVKRVFRIYPDCPAIACNYYFRGTVTAPWTTAATNLGDLRNIEGKAAEAEGKVPVTVLDRLSLPGKHWRFKAVQFFDITDRVNNLTEDVTQVAYRADSRMVGNLLFADDMEQQQGIFILKEAPSSNVQLAYPGFDFVTRIGEVQAVGVGLESKDITKTNWVKGYGVVMGVSNNGELGQLQALRSYQQNIRIHEPGRDDMILMNTWGDRNQDKRVGEKFTLEEIRAAHRLGITHFQIDDGWQTGRSVNSAFAGGTLTNIWDNPNYWWPDPKKFPNGLASVVKLGEELGVEVCLWFNPSKDDSYAHWQNDADALIRLYKDYGIRTFKIDGVQVPDKRAEINLRKMFDTVMTVTNNQAVFNLDVTAGKRYGYHYFNEYGNIFLENRYTDWSNYYPHWTLRNLWMLSKYVPPQNLQIEFLNNFRNKDKYPANDKLAPGQMPFEYTFAITMMAQPLAWFEATGLPEEGYKLAPVLKKYQTLQTDIHSGKIFPIGEEPSGFGWTGFQSLQNNKGYIIVYRELNQRPETALQTWLPAGKKVELKLVLGEGQNFKSKVAADGRLTFKLPKPNSYALYQYVIVNK